MDQPSTGALAAEGISAADAARTAELLDAVAAQMATVVEGKREVIDLTLLVLLGGGHLLIEDVPGVGKTILAKALGGALGAECHRIQFTPDLLPSDITGASIFDQATGTFTFRPGAVFTDILLADEINRASPKTQSALLEAMEEHQVSVDGVTHPLTEPFMVIATANSVEMEGTYRLPEAQRDRFSARTALGYPDESAEVRMLAHQTGPLAAGARDMVDEIRPVTSPDAIAAAIAQTRHVHTAPQLLDYAVRLARATREHPGIQLGASPRAVVHLIRVASARALATGRTYVEPEDLRALLEPVWRHRLHLRASARAQGLTDRDVLADALSGTPLRG